MTNHDEMPFNVAVEDIIGKTPTFSRKAKKGDRPSAREVLAELALDKVMNTEMRSRLVNGRIRALVVEVPDGTWAHPITDAIDAFVDFQPYKIVRTTVPRANDRGDARLADVLRSGRTVIAAAPDADLALPELMLSVTDARVAVGLPDAGMVAETIKRVQGGRVPTRVQGLRADLLSFEEITSIIIDGGAAAETVERLEILTTAKLRRKDGIARSLPKLADAIEYGAAREWALELRDDIADARAGKIGWDQVDKGCVLHGPPGTGKTLLARMLGEACGVPTIVASVGEFFATSSGYLDGVIKAQRKVFAEARGKAPCVLFLDELNGMPNADTVGDRNRDYWMPVILDFYTLLDGAMSDREGVIVVGATNRIEDIHPAILRPGRLERAIHVGPPDENGVERIMRHHLADDLADTDISRLAAVDAIRGATGAVIMEQVRAARRTARRAGRPMALDDLSAQVIGEARLDVRDLRRAAVHEAGHVVAGILAGQRLESVNVVDTEHFGGGTCFRSEEDFFNTRDDYEKKVVMLLSGRAAEQEILGAPSQGAGGTPSSDLARATQIVASMFASVGLGDTLSFRATTEMSTGLMAIDRAFEAKVSKTLADLYERALALVRANRPSLDAIADKLVEKQFLQGPEIESIIASAPPKTPSS
jgi:ATP-dependent Zn protease